MTFYELEKKCKKKKIIKIFFIFFLIIVIFLFLGVFCFFNYQKSKKTIPSSINVIQKSKKVTKKIHKAVKKIHKTKQKEIRYVLPLIDLNITQKNVFKNKIKKNIEKNKTIQNNKQLKKEIILQTTNLPSYKTCISIALKYLDQKDYQNALKWAKYANIQNKKDPKSWIVSAKALYSLGKKDAAIKLLKIYNSYYNNKEIQKLIKEIGDK